MTERDFVNAFFHLLDGDRYPAAGAHDSVPDSGGRPTEPDPLPVTLANYFRNYHS